MDQTTTPLFVLGATPPDFWWQVRVPVPGDNAYSHATFEAQFRPVDQTELDRMQGFGLAEGELPPTDEQIARRVLVGWKLQGPEGPLPFTPENLQQLLAAPMVRTAVVATYLACMRGVAARKNG